uniref:Uncharacterized protein n=1 Tax=Panagrolaimus davidi TaxID=227884 RepID=A0A914Q1Q7_9BILA
MDNFALVFDNETSCKDVIENINGSKTLNESVSVSINDSQTKLYKERFILSIMEGFHNSNIAKIVKGLISYYSDEEKQKLISLLKSKNINETLYCSLFNEKMLKNGKVKDTNDNNSKTRQNFRKRIKTEKLEINEDDNNDGSDYSPSASDSDEQEENDAKKKKLK